VSLSWPGNASGIPPDELERVVERLRASAQNAAPTTRQQIERKKMDG